ncbi:hypothetical protein H4Q26_011157 [Puccinia striiformis f. sp. tritici PST-130]|nr:hypothetical protein H4Q26_011157 [Puccinia striiformis f. sp. tritici PST-130]
MSVGRGGGAGDLVGSQEREENHEEGAGGHLVVGSRDEEAGLNQLSDIDGVPAPFWKKLSATISPGSHPWRSDLERLTTTPGGTPSWRSDLGIFWTRAE